MKDSPVCVCVCYLVYPSFLVFAFGVDTNILMGGVECETSLSAALTHALRGVEQPSFNTGPDLDAASLPRLDDFSSVEEAISTSLDDLPSLQFPAFSSLSNSLSPTVPTPSTSSISASSTIPSCCDSAAALAEISTRLRAANSETSALRARVAQLVRENRHLRSSLQTANEKLHAKNPLLLGLAHVSADVATTLSAALSIQPQNSTNANTAATAQPPTKKRKRAAAGKTLACLVLMCGFFFGTPSLLNSENENKSANLPAVWSPSPLVKVSTPPVRPRYCIRTLEQLPAASATVPEKAASSSDSDHEEEEKEASPQSRAVERQHSTKPPNQFSYVLCRDSSTALEHVRACSQRLSVGKKCGDPHSISLIMPASAVGLDSTSDVGEDEYAEVHCNIVSVARIPHAVSSNVQARNPYGRVMATVPDSRYPVDASVRASHAV